MILLNGRNMATKAKKTASTAVKKGSTTTKKVCGVVMPISAHDGCTENHWADVREILSDAIEAAGFEPNLVSDADDVGIIQKRIIQNLYENPVVVCDVSGKNPNVMFELGVRLAFDKPTIIVKDDKTSYSFDTAPIEHLEYPRDLRFARIIEFKSDLASKISATHKKASADADYTTFLKHFGNFAGSKLDFKALSQDDLIIEELRSLKRIVLDSGRNDTQHSFNRERFRDLCVKGFTQKEFGAFHKDLVHLEKRGKLTVRHFGPDHVHVRFAERDPGLRELVTELIRLNSKRATIR